MTTHGALLPGGPGPGQDRWAATPNGLIVMDGATAVTPSVPSAERYVDALLDDLRRRLDTTTDLRTILGHAIAAVSADLDLVPGEGPSSTVALLRWAEDVVDAAVLGDSTIVLGTRDGTTERLTDDRLASIAPEQRRAYLSRLAAGAGYDDEHRRLLVGLQNHERDARNTPGGYWIAEADSNAADHAEVRRYRADDVRWAVLATDGAQRGIDHLDRRWADVAAMGDTELTALLDELHRWEAETDPEGKQLPRAKRHDDKTLVTWPPNQL
ncbi:MULTISPECIES: protein phosphatase 2C domain-containing protein [unclassified Pseudonocardia]|nr:MULTISPECIES: protein phosphatase 2C domain-containing protein [unclassified Pseudonocardia]